MISYFKYQAYAVQYLAKALAIGVIIGFIAQANLACRPAEKKTFKEVADGVAYQYLKFGEGEQVESSDHLMAFITVLDKENDTLHYVPRYPYFFQVGQHPIDSVWLQLGKGDSVHIKCPRATLNQYLKLYGPMQSDQGEVTIRASIQDVMSEQEAVERRQRELSRREVEEQAELKRFFSNSPANFEEIDGIYRYLLESTKGDTLKYGDQIRISYQGYFLNGYMFDDTESKGVTPTFRYGEDFQLLEGIQSGLKGLKEGESVKIILPSRQAFGGEGSLAGIVPPYTSVIFKIKILKIEN